MATVGLSSPPKATHKAGQPWVVTIRVLQHGVRPMPDATSEVRIRNAAGKLYRARVAFPTAGRYALAVDDGFPGGACARVHTFRPVVIAAV